MNVTFGRLVAQISKTDVVWITEMPNYLSFFNIIILPLKLYAKKGLSSIHSDMVKLLHFRK